MARLTHGGSVGIPAAFMGAIDGSAIGPHVGTCGAAAFRARPMVTKDIREDPKWEQFQALATAAGLRSCWSVPLRLPDGPVLGTFAAYDDRPGTPDPGQLELAEALRLARGARPGPDRARGAAVRELRGGGGGALLGAGRP